MVMASDLDQGAQGSSPAAPFVVALSNLHLPPA